MTWAFPIYRIEPDARSSANTRNDSEGRFYKYWCVGVAYSYDIDRLDGLDSYNVENILHHLHENLVRLPSGYHLPQGVDSGADLMVGYLLFDAWLSATDRHDENWELSIDNNGYALCPTFDHGDSLGVKLSAQDREVSNFEHPALIESCWWENITIVGRVESAEISSIRAFTTAAKLYPDAARIWQEQLTQVTSTRIIEIFERVPDDRITPTAAKFAIDLLEFNRQKLIAISSRPDLQERLNADLTIKEPKSSSKQLKPPQQSL